MPLSGRNDRDVLLGVALAFLAAVSLPIARVLGYAPTPDEEWGVQLFQVLAIAAIAFGVHRMAKRQHARARALATHAEARHEAARMAEMELLAAFGQALGRSLTDDSIREAAGRHLAAFAGGRPAWAMVRSGRYWRRLAACGDVPLAACERAARRALGDSTIADNGTRADVCFPMIVAGEPLGVLGVSPDPPLTEQQRTVLSAAAALLAGALKNAELFQAMHDNSVRDALTGCFNRKHAIEVMDGELRRSQRSHLTLSLILFDLDHFKAVNDSCGHLCGDAVLAVVGQRMNSVLRGSDLKCRYGGEEFLILLPDTTLAGATRVAELVRLKLQDEPVHWNGIDVRVTASFGVTAAEPGELDTAAIIGRADAALYRAKENGRNCVCAADGREALA